ncbi:hypothetical protein BdWA1_000870 [Babesia duncani]|uniref:Uncharacterized protein n=1 Tax=Babesia duncani TaxID=323732 RepID=A0AAD9PNX4_9APIC|nr:hypothetical protein BdWA1_000870 [Babesia duncani]
MTENDSARDSKGESQYSNESDSPADDKGNKRSHSSSSDSENESTGSVRGPKSLKTEESPKSEPNETKIGPGDSYTNHTSEKSVDSEHKESTKASNSNASIDKGIRSFEGIPLPAIGVFTGTREYTCPFSLLATSSSGDSFFKVNEKEAEDFNLKTTKVSTPIVMSKSSFEEVSDDVKIVYECAPEKRLRITCHQVGSGRIQLNTRVLPSMSINKLKSRSIIFNGQLISEF